VVALAAAPVLRPGLPVLLSLVGVLVALRGLGARSAAGSGEAN
jgi:hypothetical protein